MVSLGAINCADDQNSQHCRVYEIMGYPTIRYFAPLTANFTIGETYQRTKDDPAVLRHSIIKKLEKTETTVPNWPELAAIEADNLRSLWTNKTNHLLILVVEKEDSYVGRDLILDLLNVKDVMVHHTYDADFAKSGALPQVFALKSDLSREQIALPSASASRKEIFEAVRSYLTGLGHTIVNTLDTSVNATKRVKVKQSFEQKLQVNKLYVSDLEAALSYSLFHEIGMKSTITSDSMVALKKYLRVVSKHFPFVTNADQFVRELSELVEDKSTLSGKEFRRLAQKRYVDYQPFSRKYVGCKGSTDNYRHYPCGMWMMFHTMTVRAYVNQEQIPSEGNEVLAAMTGYVKNFFGCTNCADHFVEMSKTIQGNVTTLRESVLWLWKAHNSVNNRLAGDLSEDPSFPKVQFPEAVMCPQCRFGNGSFNENTVLNYLVSMYGAAGSEYEKNSSALEAEVPVVNVVQERSERWNFRLTDVNTCIGLYVLSACLLTAYSVRFFMRRSRRAKHRYDGFNKA